MSSHKNSQILWQYSSGIITEKYKEIYRIKEYRNKSIYIGT